MSQTFNEEVDMYWSRIVKNKYDTVGKLATPEEAIAMLKQRLGIWLTWTSSRK